MTDDMKNFFSIAFAVVAVIAMGFGLWYLSDYGWDVSKYYFIAGAGLALISKFIDFTTNTDGDDF